MIIYCEWLFIKLSLHLFLFNLLEYETIKVIIYGGHMKKFFIAIPSILFFFSTIVIPSLCIAMANPASVNCINSGGTFFIQERGDGGEYGICMFQDNRQCEEWAMYRGDCPTGGVKITGYTTAAARFCVITGGIYTATENIGTDIEGGSCTFKNNICDAWSYYNGKCEKKE